MDSLLEPILQSGPRPDDALVFQEGSLWFRAICRHFRDGRSEMTSIEDVAPDELTAFLTRPKLAAGKCADLLSFAPLVMGVVNLTPDSFSDGGQVQDAAKRMRTLVEDGADILDIGGESTRPGSDIVSVEEELTRVTPALIIADALSTPVSLDTRKALVAAAGIDSGVSMINDVSAMEFDAEMMNVLSQSNLPICLMHAQGDPKTMQDSPHYENVLFEVYAYLARRINAALEAGISMDRIVADPGIGFGKSREHNLTLLRYMSVFHGLGVPLLVGASRKRMIAAVHGHERAQDAGARIGGSLAVALDLATKGVQIIRVHDVFETKQALALQSAIANGAIV